MDLHGAEWGREKKRAVAGDRETTMLVEEAMICSGHIQHHLIPLFVHLAELQLDVLHGSVHLRSPLLELDTRVLHGYKTLLLGTVELVEALQPLEIQSSNFFLDLIQKELGQRVHHAPTSLEVGVVIVGGCGF